MSKIGGINKMMNVLNRSQQKRDWDLLMKHLNKESSYLPFAPDWSKSVKKIDDYMRQICDQNFIKFETICGRG